MSMSINSPDFINKFVMNKMVVGQVGYGYIGKAVEALFRGKCNVLVHDKFNPETSSLNDVVSKAHVIFVAVPTPMKKSGECYTGIVEEVLQNIQNAALEVGRDPYEFVVIIKSTISPGFTRKMQEKYALRVMFSPEFLTEANSINDFKKTRRVILGGEFEDGQVVFKFFEGVWPNRIRTTENPIVEHPDGEVVIILTDPEVAELTKLFTNGILMTRVLFANEMYQVCQKLGVNYDEVRVLSCLDPRINPSHLLVPGPDGQMGAGGHCFPKDINSLRFVCQQLGIEEKLFTAVLERNDAIRKHKDWEDMKGRAVIDD